MLCFFLSAALSHSLPLSLSLSLLCVFLFWITSLCYLSLSFSFSFSLAFFPLDYLNLLMPKMLCLFLSTVRSHTLSLSLSSFVFLWTNSLCLCHIYTASFFPRRSLSLSLSLLLCSFFSFKLPHSAYVRYVSFNPQISLSLNLSVSLSVSHSLTPALKAFFPLNYLTLLIYAFLLFLKALSLSLSLSLF